MLKPIPLSEPTLEETLERLHQEDAVLSYHQILGLIFAVHCSPEPLRKGEWFDLLWLDDEPRFDSEQEAYVFFRQINDLAEDVKHAIGQRRFLPFSRVYRDNVLAELAQWSEGLLLGHHYLEDIWMIAQDDLDDPAIDDRIDAVLNLACTFADYSAEHQLSFGDDLALNGHLPEAYKLLWQALPSYSTVAEKLAQLNDRGEYDAEQLFLSLEGVERDQPCLCGSGLAFARCCLH